MAEYIDRQSTVDALARLCKRVCQYSEKQRQFMCGACPLGDAFTVIEDDLPAADVRPVVRGEWEKTEGFDEYGGGRYVEWTCSECFCKAKGGWAVRDKHIDEPPAWNFCPNCGAAMEES